MSAAASPLGCGVLAGDNVIEVMLNPNGRLWVECLGQPMRVVGAMEAAQAENPLMATVAAPLCTTVGRDNPIMESELPLNGSRFQALLPPVVGAPTFAIRLRHPPSRISTSTTTSTPASCTPPGASRSPRP
ncbi:Flp pilus assembly complex ATPase component TadA [Azospirillum sp. RWY-5-1]|uniref:Flp pilus assembly complex ATPase component TadA n=1 Tax=Azospirillum oleiclasticum TaxID=2735135 RepID=A0ABX2TM75_9PROT|nr:Flp pilus assembly complex ATPase component TadA [Azospirillum oleiclasticum]NYZ14586.1 Flp pilus assembly complex ATPase component TadA [Azospirillum oleiclasticum]NYZ24364.1 Flp pilus assembly complex ATPase component TadA [Azospirillum oleiclasticum]